MGERSKGGRREEGREGGREKGRGIGREVVFINQILCALIQATSSSFSLGLMLPVIAKVLTAFGESVHGNHTPLLSLSLSPYPPQLMEHMDPFVNRKPKIVKMFRDFWLYCIIMGFSNFTIGGHQLEPLGGCHDWVLCPLALAQVCSPLPGTAMCVR